jgi:hypothetical protein
VNAHETTTDGFDGGGGDDDDETERWIEIYIYISRRVRALAAGQIDTASV